MALPATIPPITATKGFFVPASARQYSTLLSLLLVAPLLVLLAFGFLYPVGRLIAGSFFNPHFTLAQHARFLSPASRFPARLSGRLRDGEAERAWGGDRRGLRPHSALDLGPGAVICVDRAPAAQRHHQQCADRRRIDLRAAAPALHAGRRD